MMRRMPVSRLLLAFLALSLSTTAALAQAPASAPPLGSDSQGWIAVVMAVVLIVAVGVGSFMSAKRTHQD